MTRSAYAIVAGAIAAVGVMLLMSATHAGWIGQPALAAPATAAQPALAAEAPTIAPAPSIVEGGGITLHSVSVNFPRSDVTFPGAGAEAINNDCLICHSAAMVLDQANLSRAQWQNIVDQMRNDFKAPFAAEDAPAIVDYLVNLRHVMSRTTSSPPDAKRGAVIAAQGTAGGAPACAQCHAFNGVSDGSGAFPRLAGQSAYYLAKQLRDFTSGIRVNAIMTPVASALTADDIADVAAYYAGIEAPFLPLRKAEAALNKQGEELAKRGSAARRLQACDNCHGAEGAGEPPAIPYLAGQYAPYIALELHMWRRGFRKSIPEAMGVVAKLLDDQEIAAVAAYYQQVRGTPMRRHRSRRISCRLIPISRIPPPPARQSTWQRRSMRMPQHKPSNMAHVARSSSP
jgi:cytochrome c553